MKKAFKALFILTALIAAKTTMAQTAATSTGEHPQFIRISHCSDHHIPPPVLKWLHEHPKAAKRIIVYIKNHHPLLPPPFTENKTVIAGVSVAPPQTPEAPKMPVIGGK